LSEIWKPHLSERVQFKEGNLRNAFSLRLETGINLTFEWRDWTLAQYETGPQFFIRNGKLHLTGRDAIELPTGEWVHFEITSALGQLPHKWTLRITQAGKPPVVFDALPFASSKFKSLTWLGFTSNANAPTVFYLDDFEVSAK